MKMSERKRLHPITAFINFLKTMKEAILPFVFLFLFGGEGIGIEWWKMIAVSVFILFSLAMGILSWLRFSYRLEEGELRIESGFFVKKKRYIPFERIQSLDFSEGIFQRPFGLVKVKVETAASSDPKSAEAVLTAIKKSEATAIQEVLAAAKSNGKIEMEEKINPSEIMYKITPFQLLLLGSTSGGAGVIISAVFAFVMQFDDIIPYEKVYNELQVFIKSGVVFISIIVFLVFLLAWLMSIVVSMFRYANFTVKKVGDDLIITRGLIEKRQMTIPLNRVQGIIIRENLIRQPLGYGSVLIVSAGGSIEKEDSSKILLLPIMRKRDMPSILKSFLTDFHFTPEIAPAPKRALKRYLFRSNILPVILIIVSLIFFLPWGYFSLLLLPLTLTWGYLKYKDAGWNLDQLQLTLTYRGLVKSTIFMKKNKIQALTIKKSFFQAKRSLATIDVFVKSGIGISGGTVVDLETQDILKIYDWYHYPTTKAEVTSSSEI